MHPIQVNPVLSESNKKSHNKGVEEDSNTCTLIIAISFISAKEQKCWLKGNSFMVNAHEKKTFIITLGLALPNSNVLSTLSLAKTFASTAGTVTMHAML